MKADTLKKSILQWAIEGKLVPQLGTELSTAQVQNKQHFISIGGN